MREFIMKDLYSFDADEAGLDVSYQKMLQAYQNIYDRCGLPAMLVEADSGAIGGKDSHEFMVIAESGEDEIIYCPGCNYAANVEKAESVKGSIDNGEPLPLEEVATPGMATIEEVAGFLKVPQSHTLKAVFYVADGELVFVVIRGDLEVNEIKLKNLLHATELRMATEAEVSEAGIVAGAASPVGMSGIRVIADDSVTSGTNFVAGGNKPDTHLKNVNYPRDFKADIVADIAKARAGDGCPKCGGKLSSTHGIEVGHVFKLGTFLSEKLGPLLSMKRAYLIPLSWAATASASAGCWRRPSSRTTMTRALSGRCLSPLIRSISARSTGKAPGSPRLPKISMPSLRRQGWRCFLTTGRSRPGSSSMMPTCWGYRSGLPSARAPWRKTALS